jgi:hypothetical protein
MSGYCVFQAHDGGAAAELCVQMPDISLLVLNTYGTGVDTPTLVREVRERAPDLPVLHIGKAPIPGMPADVVHLVESFTPDQLLTVVRDLTRPAQAPRSSHPLLERRKRPISLPSAANE